MDDTMHLTFAGIRALVNEAREGCSYARETVIDLCEAVIRYARKCFRGAADYLWFVKEAVATLVAFGAL
jgi:hypothetical protein